MAENAINNATSNSSTAASSTELEAMKQEILREMRKEMAKMKQEIIEGTYIKNCWFSDKLRASWQSTTNVENKDFFEEFSILQNVTIRTNFDIFGGNYQKGISLF